MRPVAKFLLLFTACFTSVLLLAAYASVSGWLTPRALGIVLALICVIGFGVCWFAFVKIGRKEPSFQKHNAKPAGLDSATRKRVIRSIRFCKAGIAFFVLCLFFGLAESKGRAVLPTIGGVTMNLLITTGLVLRVRQLKKALSEEHPAFE